MPNCPIENYMDMLFMFTCFSHTICIWSRMLLIKWWLKLAFTQFIVYILVDWCGRLFTLCAVTWVCTTAPGVLMFLTYCGNIT